MTALLRRFASRKRLGATNHRQFSVTFTRPLSCFDHADGLVAEVQP